MEDLESRLRRECEAIAENVLTNYDEPELIRPQDIWSSEDRDRLAQRYYDIALHQVDCARRYDGDPEVVMRAVRYLGRQAIPPLRDDPSWFLHCLILLLELARPTGPVGPEGEPFFDDIRRGMKEAEKRKRQA